LEKGISGGVPAFDADGLIDKHIFERFDPLGGRPVSANPHDFRCVSHEQNAFSEIGQRG
jgi:hypothetical protein